jgi:serine/threonine-protein kinase
MGEVYRARDTRLHREVAIKILPDAFAEDAERVARFAREAQTLATLNHPHIAHVYGVEEAAVTGRPSGPPLRALIMEFVEGEDLAARLARGPIPLDEALPIARQIAAALEAAHEQGIVHRDLKPANVKVTSDGAAKVLDFGLAKAVDATQTSPSSPPSPLHMATVTSPAMTQYGVILGTAAYMSPEQAKGRVVDHRSDIWAFGCVLYEMLTGQRAFEGEDVSDTLAAVLRATPDFSRLPSDTPVAVRTLLARCLERDRPKRVGSISTAVFVLDNGATSLSSETTRGAGTGGASQLEAAVNEARRRLIRRRVLPLTAALAVTTTAFAVLALRPQARAAGPTPARFVIPFEAGGVAQIAGRPTVAISNDGQTIAYMANRTLTVRPIAEFSGRPVTGALDSIIHSPVFSPDDRAIGYYSVADSLMKRVPIGGGTAVTVCACRQPWGLSWHPSGLIIAQGPDGIVRCPAAGGAAEQLVKLPAGQVAQGAQLLPDGDGLLFTIATTGDAAAWERAEIVVQSLTTGERHVLLRGGGDARYVTTGHLVYAIAGVLYAAPFDAATRRIGEGVPVVEGVRRALNNASGSAYVAISPAGSLVYMPGPATTARDQWYLGNVDRRGVPSRIPAPPAPYTHVRASRDGTSLAIGTDDGREAIVWIHRLASTEPLRRLTLHGRNRFPVWLPDGQRVAFQSDREGDAGIFVQRIDGTGAVDRLTRAGADEAHVPESWSPDGRHLLFTVVKRGGYELFVYSATERRAQAFAGVHSREPIGGVFSPDGRWVAYASTPVEGGMRSPNRGIFVQPFPPTGATYQAPSDTFDFHPAWSPDGLAIVFVPSAASGEFATVKVLTGAGISFGNLVKSAASVTGQRTSGLFRAWDVLPNGGFVGLVNDGGGANPLLPELRVVLNWSEELKQKVPVDFGSR